MVRDLDDEPITLIGLDRGTRPLAYIISMLGFEEAVTRPTVHNQHGLRKAVRCSRDLRDDEVVATRGRALSLEAVQEEAGTWRGLYRDGVCVSR